MKKSTFQLKEQSILNIEFVKNEDFIDENFKVSLEFSNSIEIKNDENNKIAEVIFDFSIFDKNAIEKYPFFINVKIKGVFAWDADMDNQTLENLLKINAPAILFSFIRSVVSSITAFSGYPALILPLINFNNE